MIRKVERFRSKTKYIGIMYIIGIILSVKNVYATPSTVLWTTCTPYMQPFGVLHVTYDTYFLDDYSYPIITGLTIGALPINELQLEVGFDLLFPSQAPLLLNAKVGTPEDVLFKGQPGWSLGIFNLGFEKNVNDYNILHFVVGKTMLEDWGALKYLGSINVGAYFGLNKNLFVSSEGETNQFGLMLGWLSYPIDVPLIDKIIFLADVMTGENVIGGGGGGVAIFFTPAIGLLTGPVFFFDKVAAGAPKGWIWTLQLDVDIDLKGQ